MRQAIRAAVAAAALLATVNSMAQQTQPAKPGDGTVARLTDVTGNVLVSRESGLASGTEALRLLPGMRVLTTANSEVVVEYDDGCRVHLKENQRFEVERGKPCAVLMASPATIIAAPAAVAGLAPLLIPGILGAASVGSLIDSRGGQTVSPN